MSSASDQLGVVSAFQECPAFAAGDSIRVLKRCPVGHYRVPLYLRGCTGRIEAVLEPAAIDNEEEGYGRNAGPKRYYYRIAVPMLDVWPAYAGAPRDSLLIEVFESWLERA